MPLYTNPIDLYVQTEPFFRSQVLKELGIEDPLLNVAQELEKVPSPRDLWLQKVWKNVLFFYPWGPPKLWKMQVLQVLHPPKYWVIIPKDWFLPIILAGNWLLFEAIQQP